MLRYFTRFRLITHTNPAGGIRGGQIPVSRGRLAGVKMGKKGAKGERVSIAETPTMN